MIVKPDPHPVTRRDGSQLQKFQKQSLSSSLSDLSVQSHPLKPRLLKAKDAAAYLAVGIDKLRLFVVQGHIPYIPGAGASAPWLFDIRDLDRWIDRAKIHLE